MSLRTRRSTSLALSAALVCALGVAANPAHAQSEPTPLPLGHAALPTPEPVEGATAASAPRVASSSRSAYLLKLETSGTLKAYDRAGGQGPAARRAAKAQQSKVEAAQEQVIADLPSDAAVLYRTHAVLPGVAVMADSADASQLAQIDGVSAVYPIAPKSPSLTTSIPLQGGPTAWDHGTGTTGQGVKIAIIDTGIDYTHADFGGTNAYTFAQAEAVDDASWKAHTTKVVDGYDLAGRTYNAASTDPADWVPHPDLNPLDCGGHGTHVAGIAAGQGVTDTGATYTGLYDSNIDYNHLRIGPGMAPDASLLAFKVFGCTGSTNLVTDALDMAMDPLHGGPVDVINMSLGSDFGSPQDADSMAANAAVEAGATVVASSGNGGDLTDVGGSPGNAVKVLTVANSVDSSSVIDGLNLDLNGSPATYGATRAIRYTDWSTADLSGDVVAAPAGNEDACLPYTNQADKDAIKDKVVLVKWTQGALECGSITRGQNLRAAGAKGFIFGNSEETFDAGINGDTVIPGVLVVKSGADAIRAQLALSNPVSVTSTTANSVIQDYPEDNDTLAGSSSRGIHAAGNVKPDVTAVGTSVFSAAVGTGTEGISETGTSMSSPTVAGLAALVKQSNPTWTPEQIKSSIMNTAGADLFTGKSQTGDRYAPARVGTGRIMADKAVDNQVTAAVVEDPGAVSVSFGPVTVSGPTMLTKTVRVTNNGASAVTYATSYAELTSVAGVNISVAPANITVAAGGTQDVTVTLTAASRGALDNSVDPTVGRISSVGTWRTSMAEASGRLLLTPASGTELRVPVYAAPRPAAALSAGTEVTLDPRTNQGSLTVTGTGLGFGANGTMDSDPTNDINSIGAGFELAATSDVAPPCGGPVVAQCYWIPDEQAVDIRNVGVSVAGEFAYFAITAEGPWSIPANHGEFDVMLNTDADPQAEYALYNSRLTGTDTYVSALYNLALKRVIDVEYLDGLPGNIDTAQTDSNAIILPLWLPAIPGLNPANPRIHYGVEGWSPYQVDPVDLVGEDPVTGALELSVDVFQPGLAVTNTAGQPIYAETGGTVLGVTMDPTVYAANNSQGLLLLHLHNAVGSKAEVLTLRTAAAPTTTSLGITPASVAVGTPVSLAVGVGGALETPPTGQVEVVSAETGAVLTAGPVDATGHATFSYTPGVAGSVRMMARYLGDAANAASASGETVLTVTSPPPPPGQSATSTNLTVNPSSVVRGLPVTLVAAVTSTGGAPDGTVSVVDRATGAVVASGGLVGGRATLQFTPVLPNLMTLQAVYPGSATYSASSSLFAPLEVAKAPSQMSLQLSKKSGKSKKKVTATVTVATVNAIPATGVVALTNNGKVVATGTLVNGTATIVYAPKKKGKRTIQAIYDGDSTYLAGKSDKVTYKVK